MPIPQICPKCHSYDLTDLVQEYPFFFQHSFGWEETIECNSCDNKFFTTDERLRLIQVWSSMTRYTVKYPEKNVMEYLVELFVEKTYVNFKRAIIWNMTDLKELLKLKLFAAPEFYPYFKAQITYLQQTNPVLVEIESSIDRAIPKLKGINQGNFGYFEENNQIIGLKLNDKKIIFFPYQIVKLPKLQHLELCNLTIEYYDTKGPLQMISLQNIPEDIGHLTQLSYLNLQNNGLKALPGSLCTLQNLTSLHLADNELEVLPEELGNLLNLRELTIQKNKLTYLPKSFDNLINLTSLHLDRQLYKNNDVGQVIEKLIENSKVHGREFQLQII